MTNSNVGPQPLIGNAENRLREKNVIGMDLRTLGRVLIGYLLVTAPLFGVSTVMFGIKDTLWGLAIFHFGCFLAVMAVWWQEERQWSRAAWSKHPVAIRSALVASPAADPSSQLHPSSTLWLSTPYLRQGKSN